ncbi:esterase/lipase family protein [Croceicoccus ponticola]|uniref:esterase/lipase family protein n=1 Tax=Croceicoccus ponticola TaxID=2217664 RepID=UPI00196B6A82|nr:alpha/beta fold hydrolase [Croceicoccus ponticola]
MTAARTHNARQPDDVPARGRTTPAGLTSALPGRGFSLLFDEFRRRHRLASRPHPAGVATPRAKLLFSEFASLAFPRVYSSRYGKPVIERCDVPRAVMLLPGFGSHPWRMSAMRRELVKAGHSVTDWGLGWNLGASEDRFDRLLSRIERVSQVEARKIVLVGWSLGGVFAREAAKALPDHVAMVVTMGSPFSGNMHGNNAWRVYHWIAGHAVDNPPVGQDFAAKPPMRTVALWSAKDGVVHRHCACGRAGERDASVAVRCTHMGFAWHPAAIEAVAKVLHSTPTDGMPGDGTYSSVAHTTPQPIAMTGAGRTA